MTGTFACLPLLLGGPAGTENRPTLSGAELVTDDGAFEVHWTHEGADAIALDDDDANGLPDTVDRVVAALQLGKDFYQQRGFDPVQPDNGEAGSASIDVYLRAIDTFGLTFPVLQDSGGMSARPHYSCFMELNRELDGSEEGMLESVAVHELHHCVQFGYTVGSDPWIYEASATHEQYLAVSGTGLDGAVDALWGIRLAGASRPVDDTGSRFEYAGMVLPKFFEEFGEPDPMRSARLWEALSEEPDWRIAFDDLAQAEWGLSWDAAFQQHAVWNALACGPRNDGVHYVADALGCTLDSISAPSVDAAAGTGTVELGGAWSAGYLTFRPEDVGADYRVTCEGPATTRLSLLAFDGDTLVQQANGEASEAVLPSATDEVLAVVTAAEKGSVTCTGESIDAGEDVRGCGCRTVQPSRAWVAIALAGALGAVRRRPREQGPLTRQLGAHPG